MIIVAQLIGLDRCGAGLGLFRAQAVDSMAQTVTALEGQIQRAQPYLERVRRGELAGGS